MHGENLAPRGCCWITSGRSMWLTWFCMVPYTRGHMICIRMTDKVWQDSPSRLIMYSWHCTLITFKMLWWNSGKSTPTCYRTFAQRQCCLLCCLKRPHGTTSDRPAYYSILYVVSDKCVAVIVFLLITFFNMVFEFLRILIQLLQKYFTRQDVSHVTIWATSKQVAI